MMLINRAAGVLVIGVCLGRDHFRFSVYRASVI